MNKKLIAVAIAGAFVGVSPAVMAGTMAVDVKGSGFIDTILTFNNEIADDTGVDATGSVSNPDNTKFSVDGELDFSATQGDVMARIDLDVNNTHGNFDSGEIEQAFSKWQANDAVAVMIGQVNSGIGFEAEDAPNLYQITHGQIYDILDSQTALRGNNVQGVVVNFAAGPASINVGVLDELGRNDEANSLLLQASGSPMDGMNLEFSFITQEDYDAAFNPSSGGNLWDLNGTYGMDNWFVGLEIMDAADDGDGLPDNAYGLYGHIDAGNGFGATLRYDTVAYNDVGAVSVDDTTSTTLAGSYAAADNLGFNLEIRSDDNGTDSFSSVLLEAVATLGDFN